MARNKIYLKKYQALFEKEIIAHFGSITDCEKVCHVQRSNIYKAITPGNGYISEKMLHIICRKMGLSPLCFLDDSEKHPFHSAYYNSHYKMTYTEYKALAYTASHAAFCRQSLEHQRQCNPDDYLIDHTLKLYTGISDQELDQLDSKTKIRLRLSITSAINEILSESLPTWN